MPYIRHLLQSTHTTHCKKKFKKRESVTNILNIIFFIKNYMYIILSVST